MTNRFLNTRAYYLSSTYEEVSPIFVVTFEGFTKLPNLLKHEEILDFCFAVLSNFTNTEQVKILIHTYNSLITVTALPTFIFLQFVFNFKNTMTKTTKLFCFGFFSLVSRSSECLSLFVSKNY